MEDRGKRKGRNREIPKRRNQKRQGTNQCCGSGSGIWCFLDPLDPGSGSGMGKKSISGMIIPDHISAQKTIFWVKSI
jgi:hypothetical protein